jgi:putative Mn2+ efflux pump MntP
MDRLESSMNLLLVLAIALGLAMDAFAVALGTSLALPRVTARQTFRLAFHFGLFQFVMPILGWLAGEKIVKLIENYDHWVAFGLLILIGGKMIIESFKFSEKKRGRESDPTKGSSLVVLSVATSIDALAVGLSLAALRVNIVYPAAVIGLVAFLMTGLGMKIAPVLGKIVGKRVELAGGVVLILVGLKILADHL